MPKIQRFTAAFLAVFVIVMLFLLVVGMDFQDATSFNTIFKNNPGMFWGSTTIVLIAFFVIKYAEVTYALEVQKWLEKLDEKNIIIEQQNKTIVSQNKTIIGNQQKDIDVQEEHLEELIKLRELNSVQTEKVKKIEKDFSEMKGKVIKNEKIINRLMQSKRHK